MFYEVIFDPQDGEPVQWLGVYALRWQPEWGKPSVAFREAEDIEATLQAKDEIICDLVTALEDADGALRHHPGGDNRLTINIYKAAAAIKEATDAT